MYWLIIYVVVSRIRALVLFKALVHALSLMIPGGLVPIAVVIVHLTPSHRAGVRCAVHGVVHSLTLILGQHLLFLIPVPVAVGTLLVSRGRHRLVALSLSGA